MSGFLLTRYAEKSMPPEARVENFILGDNRLTWVKLFFENFKDGEIYLVGGTVRDVLLGRIPNDIDIVVRNVAIEELEHWLQRQGAVDFVGKRFGTFKFIPHGLASYDPIDIALPRLEEIGDKHNSGRRDLKVKFDHLLSIGEDLARRDFTVNAIAYDFKEAVLIDPFMGIQDLKNGIIRAVLSPQKRFVEDATRIIRGLRFASQLNFSIEQNTWDKIISEKKLLNNTVLNDDGKHIFVIPREAIGKEFLLGFSRHPIYTLDLWEQAGVLKMFLPSVSDQIEQDYNGINSFEMIKRVLHLLYKKELRSAHSVKNIDISLLVSVLFIFTQKGNDHALHICRDLYFHQFSKKHPMYVDCNRLFWYLDNLRMFEEKDPASIQPSKFEKLFLHKYGRQLLLLMHAYYLSLDKHSIARERVHVAERIRNKMQEYILQNGNGEKLQRLVTGKDIEKFGVEKGPVYRELLDKIRDAQLLQKISNEEEAKKMLHKLVLSIN